MGYKPLLLFISLFLLTACGSGGSNAVEDPCAGVAKSVAASVTVVQAESTVYVITGSDLDGVAGLDIIITYDSGLLTYPTVTTGPAVKDALINVSTTTGPGQIRIRIISKTPLHGAGNIALLSFGSGHSAGGILSVTMQAIDSQGAPIASQAAFSNSSTVSMSSTPPSCR